MLLPTMLSVVLFLFQAALSGVYAKCCREDPGGDCGDDSSGTPCCGYKPCNGFCCDCLGVQVIREVIETSSVKWTSIITAPAGTTWTCRASHVTTWYPIPTDAQSDGRRREARATVVLGDGNSVATVTTKSPLTLLASVGPHVYNPKMLADLQENFDRVCGGRENNGTSVIFLDQYFGFFNVTSDRKDTGYGKSVEAKFHAHDINGDGMLTIEEVQLRCDSDGCE